MSNPPDIVTGELEAADVSRRPAGASEHRELWLSGTELPPDTGRWTSEGAQELGEDAEGEALATQMGAGVRDDYLERSEVSDEETQIINMGPQHPATHGVLRLNLELDGETIRRVKPIIGYLHTGMEKTAETLTFAQGATNVTRMDYLSPFHNELAFSLATEQLLGVDIPPRARVIRVLMTELNRLSSHLVWVATQGMDVGALSMMLYGFRERELILAFFEKTTGLRMNHNYIRPGGVAADLPDGWEEDVAEILEVIPRGIADYETLLTENPIFMERTQGVGVITPEECHAFGVTGPNARAAGVDWDLRKAFPYSGFEEYEFDVPTGRHGDVYDRYLVRIEEMRQSLSLVRQAAERMPRGDYRTDDRKVTPPPRARIDQSMEALIHHFKIFTEGFRVPEGEAYQAVESPRGELGMYLVSSGGAKPWRLHVRAPSFANVQALPVMLADSLIADTIATLASLDPVLGDVDR
ncbi:MAG: NADH-quinone oxidoreductase subunit D [Actinobacteria bacterium]|nr:NADH-quinone oxidoreductase subunit D [Actinomycetota bacterium]